MSGQGPFQNVDIEGRIKTIEGLLQRSVTETDRSALEVMIVAAVEEKRRRQALDLDTLMSKYGISSTPDKPIDVITVTDSPKTKVLASKVQKQKHPTPSKSTVKKNTPPKKPSSKSQKPIVKGPPTKRKKPSTPEESPASANDSDAAYEPDSCLSSEDEIPQSSKKKRKTTPGRSATKKKTTLGKRPDLAWCSSESELDTNGKKKEPVVYTNEELFTLYDTIDSRP